ncbi:MAG: hypothetical protein KA191_12315 [Verrucomicrobia bacterium]|jgi:hypothetical protein|nr:hypothetical protein [Verrucomicrobiota bacterium]MDI9379736.1 hypothetical protein [Verrucomicrobiota bacterium]NMD19759.1 hypothetical protein [Verrucomicrobiota bacterium]HNV00236.1 hypothetical protein [Verrucomicrobiota bacterium]HOA61976.1 hypothetical protein [Verrucomicrobiota bacterium]
MSRFPPGRQALAFEECPCLGQFGRRQVQLLCIQRVRVRPRYDPATAHETDPSTPTRTRKTALAAFWGTGRLDRPIRQLAQVVRFNHLDPGLTSQRLDGGCGGPACLGAKPARQVRLSGATPGGHRPYRRAGIGKHGIELRDPVCAQHAVQTRLARQPRTAPRRGPASPAPRFP